ncbi:ATP-binding protein [Ralstonia pseudosolanacearum]|uniref:ATP-binding protein n=1 Tax=Ralstonia pseudosolanacearum TaxID=1310165 RepID=UPI0026752AB7|nr:ATP-binding protein [Ralstonia pseudosolanacearum]MDO3507190.1 ATP-binding protein [Ralstonia pseudosolanacearum]MDO3606886.1 ATP-binding protein [Ralstonia pseudosolanacearum]MDO3611387.1 ATP-binding protein [Ralstonia pseudosolanacearum]
MATDAGSQQSKVIHADPTKDFFVKMITRDIELRDCLFDLLDNSIDGARRAADNSAPRALAGKFAHITFDRNGFLITDNCGGIRLSDAIDYAFHFGRRAGSPTDVSGGIGLYGIGMKRAIFKMGNNADVLSEAEDACFRVTIDVPTWEASTSWDFEYEDAASTGVKGTSISITSLNSGVAAAFEDPVWRNQLITRIARDYAFFLSKGFEIKIGDQLVPLYSYNLRENENLQPITAAYTDEGVHVRIVAGLIDDLPDDIPVELAQKDVDRFGWTVICNDRVVLAGDKTERTIWGRDEFKVWHPQYNGFAGFVFFEAEDQRLLPWTTTKREVDSSSQLYRRTLVKLREITEEFTAYTNRRKEDLAAAREAERPRLQVDVYAARDVKPLRLPGVATVKLADPLVNIAFKRKLSEVNDIRRHLSNLAMSYRDIGIATFDYYMEAELGK